MQNIRRFAAFTLLLAFSYVNGDGERDNNREPPPPSRESARDRLRVYSRQPPPLSPSSYRFDTREEPMQRRGDEERDRRPPPPPQSRYAERDFYSPSTNGDANAAYARRDELDGPRSRLSSLGESGNNGGGGGLEEAAIGRRPPWLERYDRPPLSPPPSPSRSSPYRLRFYNGDNPERFTVRNRDDDESDSYRPKNVRLNVAKAESIKHF